MVIYCIALILQHDTHSLMVDHKTAIILSFAQNYCGLPEVPLLHPKIGGIWSFSQNHHQLPEVPLVQPKISTMDLG